MLIHLPRISFIVAQKLVHNEQHTQSELERRARLSKKLFLFGRRLAAQALIPVRKPSKALNDFQMGDGVVNRKLCMVLIPVGSGLAQVQTSLLVIQAFTVHEGQVRKQRLHKRKALMKSLCQKVACNLACQLVILERMASATVEVSGELIQDYEQGKARISLTFPRLQLAFASLLVQITKIASNVFIHFIVFPETLLKGHLVEPKVQHPFVSTASATELAASTHGSEAITSV